MAMPSLRSAELRRGQPVIPADRRSFWQRPFPPSLDAENRDDLIRGIIQLANGYLQIVPMEIDAPFDPAAQGLKEIGNLASWTVSSCKPGCGVEALRDDDTNLFWQ